MGTAVVISEAETTVNAAGAPLNVTLVASLRSVPRILTAAATLPEMGNVSTNGARPRDRLKTVPSKWDPPFAVVAYNVPSVSWTNPPAGPSPSVHGLCVQKV